MLFTKIMQTSGKRACSCLPECRSSYTKIMKGECNGKTGNIGFPGLDTAEPPLILSKDNANERQKSLLMFARVPLISTKVYKNIVISCFTVFFRICNNSHRPVICIYMYSFSHVFVYVLCLQKNCHTYSMVENESPPPCMNALM